MGNKAWRKYEKTRSRKNSADGIVWYSAIKNRGCYGYVCQHHQVTYPQAPDHTTGIKMFLVRNPRCATERTQAEKVLFGQVSHTVLEQQTKGGNDA